MQPRRAVLADNAHFSDSDSSVDVGGVSDDESQLDRTGPAETAMGAPALPTAPSNYSRRGSERGSATDGGRRRRSGGLPSLISRTGSKSNLGVENGSRNVHEISR